MQPKYLSAVFLLALSTGAIGQTTWYVDGIRGNNSNPGTSPTQAFATITQALSYAGTGEVVYVLPGVYSATNGESLPMQFTQGVTLLGADPRLVIIDAEYDPVAGTGHAGDILKIKNNCLLSGVTVRNGAHGGNTGWWSGAVRIFDRPSIDNVTVENCFFYNAARAIYVGWGGNGGEGISNVTIRNNLAFRCTADAIGMWGDNTGATVSSGNLIVNNTVIGVPTTGFTTRTAILLEHNVTADVYNNNCYGYSRTGLEVGGGAGSTMNAGYNNLWDSTGKPLTMVNTVSTFNQAAPDTSSDPLLADALNGDPHLLEGSPCIDAGDPSYLATMDIDGNGLQGQAIDQGCDERMLNPLEIDMYFWSSVEAGATAEMKLLGKAGHGAAAYLSPGLSIVGPINLGSMGTLYIEPLTMILYAGAPTLGTGGVLAIPCPIPTSAEFLGIDIHFQSIGIDPSSLALGLSDLETVQIAD